jgi:hypothetical protein
MSKKPLIETNPYLRDSRKYRKGLIANVSSSTSIETGKKMETIARALSQEGEALRLKKRQGSGFFLCNSTEIELQQSCLQSHQGRQRTGNAAIAFAEGVNQHHFDMRFVRS